MFAALLDFILFILIAPALLVFGIVQFLAELVRTVFEVHLLACAAALAAIGWALWPHITPDTKRPFVTLIELVAQLRIGGIPLPALMFFMSAGCLISSFVAAVILNKPWGERQ